MNERLQERIQRYGWDRAAGDYDVSWQAQLAPARDRMLGLAAFAPGQRVLDVACGTGLVSFGAAEAVGPEGTVVGVDISGGMVGAARERAAARGMRNVSFARMPADRLELDAGSFDVVLCGFGLMYVSDPLVAVREMQRVLRPGGRIAVAVWGGRAQCAWSDVFPIVEHEVQTEVCPLFFRLGEGDALRRALAEAGFRSVEQCRLQSTLDYADGDSACAAVFAGGPVAMAWSRFDEAARLRVKTRYLQSIAAYGAGRGYRVPGEFVIGTATT